MAAHHLAKGLASLGRGNDSMLMHVTPNEVAGLQTVAKSMGGSLTVNPHTGLPEAGFFDFLGSMAPWLVGAMLAPETMGGSLAGAAETSTGGALASQITPIAAGAATGAAIAGAKGEDPLMGGIMGGVGGWGGSSTGTALKNMGAANTAATAATPFNATPEMIAENPTGFEAAKTLNAANPGTSFNPSTTITPGGTSTYYGATPSPLDAAMAGNPPTPSMFDTSLTRGIDKLTSPGGWEAYKNALGPKTSDFKAGFGLAAPVGMAALSAMQPDPLKMGEEDKYDPYATLNLSGDTGLRFPRAYADGGAVDVPESSPMAGGIEALYGTKDGTSLQNTPQDGYGIGRLNALAQGGATGYAKGGYLDGPGDGMSDLSLIHI